MAPRGIRLYSATGAFSCTPRGTLFKNDDVVVQRLDDLQGVRYTEEGIIAKRGIIRVQGFKSEMDLSGPAEEIKTLYQQMMRFM